jgi:hypothetical protein
MPSSASPLATLLGADLPPTVAALPADVHAELAEYLAAARKAQNAALEGSINSALKAVPLPLRGVVKKVLLG